jgi:hypothetical protein
MIYRENEKINKYKIKLKVQNFKSEKKKVKLNNKKTMDWS